MTMLYGFIGGAIVGFGLFLIFHDFSDEKDVDTTD